MRLDIGDAVGVVHSAVCFQCVGSAETVLHDHERQMIPSVVLVQRVAQAVRVQAPAPLAVHEVGVLGAHVQVAACRLSDRVGGSTAGRVIGVGDHIHRTLLQVYHIFRRYVQIHAVFFPDLWCKVWVRTLGHHVGSVVDAFLQFFLHQQHVLGVTGQWVGTGSTADHAAHHIFRIDLMSTFHGTGAGHILVVQQLEILPDVLCRVTRDQILDHEGHVDLIEGEPVFDQTFVLPEERLSIAVKQLDQPAVLPAAKRFFQIQRHIVMLDGDQRLDAVLLQFQKYVPVKIQTSLIGRFLHAVGVNARPGDGHAEHLEPHLRKEGNVLLVVMVKINGFVVGVVVPR